MIRFTTLSIKNFLSYGAVPTVVNLDKSGTTLVVGEDLDNTERGMGANGCGKTVWLNALVYALYDKPISNISKDNLVNNINKKNMEVTLDFHIKDDTYHIKRARKTKAGAAGNWVQLFKNGDDITPDSVSNTNSAIEKIIGIPFDLFVRVVAVSATHTPFLDLPVRHPTSANQTDIIEELFDLKTLSEKAVILKKEIVNTETSLAMNQTRIELLQREHARHQEQILSAQLRISSWDDNNRKEIDDIRDKLKRVDGVDIQDQSDKITELKKIEASLREATNSRDNHKRELVDETNKNKNTVNELKHLESAECPYCQQQLTGVADKITVCKNSIDSANLRIENIGTECIHIGELIVDLQTKRKLLSKQITVTNIDELIEINNEVQKHTNHLIRLEAATNPFTDSLNELIDVKLEPIDMDNINKLTTKIEHQKFLLKLLTKKDSFVRKALLNKNIPFLNQRLTHYLTELGLPHTVEFTHEMIANISQFGRELDFGNLSNGQRARVNIALSFAFRDVLQNIYSRINVCILDEALDVGLDAIGVQSAARMLKKKSRTENISLYIISIRDEMYNVFDHTLTVQMSKGFSHIKEN
jgi:DNA repair exonuclease SbcCD ATPase subunit